MKNILLLGGTGSLGRLLLDELLKDDSVDSIRIYANSEYRMVLLQQCYNDPRIRYILGDIRDKSKLSMAFKDITGCYNCIALKHVSICEHAPFEAIATNVIGTQNAVECAIENNIDLFVQISTDKSVNPTNTYGRTKALAEDIVLNAVNWQGRNRTKFIVIRSANIKYSSGSCFEIWDSQVKQGRPLTITCLDAVRYMANGRAIARTMIDISSTAKNGLYVLSMPKYTVRELISKYGYYPIEIVGLRKGEKLIEELARPDEEYTMVEVEEDDEESTQDGAKDTCQCDDSAS